MIPKNRDQQLISKLLFARMPIDIKVSGIAARGAVFENIPPIAVSSATNGHVIGNNVKHLPQVALAEPFRETIVCLGAAQLVIDLVIVHNIVSMFAARSSLQI